MLGKIGNHSISKALPAQKKEPSKKRKRALPLPQLTERAPLGTDHTCKQIKKVKGLDGKAQHCAYEILSDIPPPPHPVY